MFIWERCFSNLSECFVSCRMFLLSIYIPTYIWLYTCLFFFLHNFFSHWLMQFAILIRACLWFHSCRNIETIRIMFIQINKRTTWIIAILWNCTICMITLFLRMFSSPFYCANVSCSLMQVCDNLPLVSQWLYSCTFFIECVSIHVRWKHLSVLTN